MANGIGARLAKRTNEIMDNTSRIIRKAALSGFNIAVRTTPVDTGRARGAWGVSFNLESIPEPGSLAVSQWKQGPIYLVNPLPYAIPLDEGSSKQAPAGMSKFAIAEARRVLKQANLGGG